MIALLKLATAVMGIGVVAMIQFPPRNPWHRTGLAMTLAGIIGNIALALIAP